MMNGICLNGLINRKDVAPMELSLIQGHFFSTMMSARWA